jgi:hypothetical protein
MPYNEMRVNHTGARLSPAVAHCGYAGGLTRGKASAVRVALCFLDPTTELTTCHCAAWLLGVEGPLG